MHLKLSWRQRRPRMIWQYFRLRTQESHSVLPLAQIHSNRGQPTWFLQVKVTIVFCSQTMSVLQRKLSDPPKLSIGFRNSSLHLHNPSPLLFILFELYGAHSKNCGLPECFLPPRICIVQPLSFFSFYLTFILLDLAQPLCMKWQFLLLDNPSITYSYTGYLLTLLCHHSTYYHITCYICICCTFILGLSPLECKLFKEGETFLCVPAICPAPRTETEKC